jgi:hypothetical protein
MMYIKKFNESKSSISESKDDIVDLFIMEVADEIGLIEIKNEDVVLGSGFMCAYNHGINMFWSEYVNKAMKQLVITIVIDKNNENERVNLMKSFMDRISKDGYHSYLEKFPYDISPNYSYLITITDRPFKTLSSDTVYEPMSRKNNNIIYPRWGGRSSNAIKYVV